MTPAVGKLIELGSVPFACSSKSAGDGLVYPGDIGAAIRDVLARKDGFFCFESALRIFPSMTVDWSWGISEWNARDLWKADYRGLADNIFCFAEDVFGRQFVVHNDKVSVFEPETGAIDVIASSLEEWAAIMLLDFKQMTAHALAHSWQSIHGPLHPRHRLMPKRPFVLGGDYAIENLAALDSVRIMKSLGNLASQIHDLPDGANIQFKVL
jgi:hypothetical protein